MHCYKKDPREYLNTDAHVLSSIAESLGLVIAEAMQAATTTVVPTAHLDLLRSCQINMDTYQELMTFKILLIKHICI